MIWLLIVLFGALTVASVMIDGEVLSVFSITGCLGSIVAMVIVTTTVISGRYIDPKIAMYQEENQKIEAQMDILIQNYMEYESNALANFKPESSITLVSMYPELKTDTLIQMQLETYVANNSKIKELKEAKITLGEWKWWLYFGG